MSSYFKPVNCFKIVSIELEYLMLYNCKQMIIEKVHLKRMQWNIENMVVIAIEHLPMNQILAASNP